MGKIARPFTLFKPLMLEATDVTIDPHNERGWPQNRRQLEFARLHIIEGYSAHDAALRSGYKPTTAKSKSHELARKLQPFLSHLQRQKNRMAEIEFRVTPERVIQGLAAIAFVDIDSYYTVVTLKGGVGRIIGRPPCDLTVQQLSAVKRWTVVEHECETGRVPDYQYVFVDRIKALLALAKCVGLFNERIQIELLRARSHEDRPDLSSVPNDVLQESIETLERVRENMRRSALPALAQQAAAEQQIDGSC